MRRISRRERRARALLAVTDRPLGTMDFYLITGSPAADILARMEQSGEVTRRKYPDGRTKYRLASKDQA